MNWDTKNAARNDWNCLSVLNDALSAHGISYSVNFACGFFTAVLSSKDQVPTQEWLGLFTSESKADSLDSANKLLQCLLAVYNKLAIQLYEDKFEPVLWESAQITDWSRSSATSVVDWCVGYCHGVDIISFTWLEGQYPHAIPMIVLGSVIDLEDEEMPTDADVLELAMDIPMFAQHVYDLAFHARESENVWQPKKNKLGSHDLCHCGSRIKYKKCCLEADKRNTLH